ncbi:MFS transporter [Lampropedia aestuarii]|uniref:MFS transporter n=1 Tax=Lampropedia aestuarii TaxID=2562762 RepID=UPI0024699550|nr:MFS transporter [Lampropedia aestuarii]MDH5857367.1 MFS transporter [Lampropedia aestuarii]
MTTSIAPTASHSESYASSPAPASADTKRAATSGFVGTLIEYYDFSLYGYMAVVIAPLFFPSGDPTVSLLAALAVFGTAYVIRPLGGIVFGHIGDKYGRKNALLGTLVCMGVGSTLMGVLPTFEQAGYWATGLLVLVRLLQGFSAGGEVGGSATFISESTPKHLKATFGAFTPMGSTGGFALAAAVAGTVSMLTTPEQMSSWGWRIPFLLAFPLTLLCIWARTRVKETYQNETKKKEHSPIGELFRKQPKALLQSTAISAATNGTAYIGLTYMSIHLITQLGYPRSSVYWIATLAIGISAILMPLGGYIGDRIGLRKLMLIGLIGYIVLTVPMMALMDQGLAIATLAYIVLMLNTVATQVSAYTLLPLLFEPQYRYTGVASGWNFGVIIAGGTAPYVAVQLVQLTGNKLSPALFVIAAAAVGLMGILSIKRDTTRAIT